MFKLKYDKILDNVIFTKNNLKPVVEDYFDINDLSFCVADGVTRDDIYGNPVIYPQTYEEAMEWIEKYPNPSGASKAAQIVCKTFINEISKYSHEKINKKIILKIAKQCNYALKSINDNRVIDYLKEDYYCCEAVGGIIVGDYLYCFSLGDCHITLLDSDFNVIFNTINNHSYFEKYLKDVYSKNNIFSWDSPKDRAMVRKEYRNCPSKKYNGKSISFGAFSGEKNAEYYINTYKVKLNNIKYICAYSDGCEPFFKNKKTIKDTLENIKSLEYTGKERTLIVYEKED